MPNEFVPVKEVVADMLDYMKLAQLCVALETLKYGVKTRVIPMPFDAMPLTSNMSIEQARKICETEWAQKKIKKLCFTVEDNG